VSEELERQFTSALLKIYRHAGDEARFTDNILFLVLDHGGLAVAKTFIHNEPSFEYAALRERQRLDLTVEAVVCDDPKWHVLFTPEELRRAEARLALCGYKPERAPPT
jgi:hypothetical protein